MVTSSRQFSRLLVGRKQLFSTSSKCNASGLSLLTWNIWFDDNEMYRRFEHILDFIHEKNVDVVCLQEATTEFLELLKHRTWHSEYDMSDGDLSGSTIGDYGVLMMCKRSLGAKFSFHSMPSKSNRKLLIGTLLPQLTVGTVHLESRKRREFRKQQLGVCEEHLRPHPNAILCGDFNICSYRNRPGDEGDPENNSVTSILHEYSDMWNKLKLTTGSSDRSSPTAGTADFGYTYGGNMRLDRVMLKSLTQEWTATSIELVGTKPIFQDDKTGYTVFASDHFGLLTRLNCTRQHT